VSFEHKIPIFITEPGEVRKGALAGIGISYKDWGRESGTLAATIIKNHTLPKNPVRPAISKTIILNQKIARSFSLALPPELFTTGGRNNPKNRAGTPALFYDFEKRII
jgi:putative ABC transport system substrate-binding protein